MNKLFDLVKIILRPIYRRIMQYITTLNQYYSIKKVFYVVKKNNAPVKVFYLGTTIHNNLGDNAQFYCIRNWINTNYPNVPVYEFIAPAIVNPKLQFASKLRRFLKRNDVIIFQSGYTTQDLGGQHEEMHRLIIDNFPNANILMMPQTIFFQNKENEVRCSKSYNKANRMLFLARDTVSYDKAKYMFPDVSIRVFPDIVTTLIGQYEFNNKRDNILLCRRNDGEKYYNEEDLNRLKHKLESDFKLKVDVSDTSIKMGMNKLHRNLESVLESEFAKYSKYKLVITDRYHGTIFSLIAGTPVVVIKTTDHKVVTGVDWFKGVYDDYVHYAESLEICYEVIGSLLNKNISHNMYPYFNNNYYSKLKDIFNSVANDDL
jgi:exopolysaccharide biosynthesis predicted pyruvyltransferase EpsI